MTLCTDLTLVKKRDNAVVAEPLYCKRWSCSICAPRRSALLCKEAKAGNPKTFITLTVNPAWGGSKDERARRLVTAWRMMRQWLRRQGIAEKIPFLAVMEETKAGEPHLHIVCRAPFIPQAKMSGFMARYMDAPVVDIRRARSRKGVAIYVAKYVSKGTRAFLGCKRYWRSADYLQKRPQKRRKSADFIAIIRRNYNAVMEDYRGSGITYADCLGGGTLKVGWWSGDFIRR